MRQYTGAHRRQSGLTLVELLIAMVLGLVLVAAVISIFLSSRETFRLNEALSQVQEAGRMSFELLARDLREAGFDGCASNDRVANTLNDAAGGRAWWQDWVGLRGIAPGDASAAVDTGTDTGQRVAGTAALIVQSAEGIGRTIEQHQANAANIKISDSAAALTSGDIVMACDFSHATIFQVSNYNPSTRTVVHNTGGSIAPGNCSAGLGFPTDCSNPGNAYQFAPGSQIYRLSATAWYIGNNDRDGSAGRSLYRARLNADGSVQSEEVVPGITDMRLRYREAGSADLVATPSDWSAVDALEVTLTVLSDRRGVTGDHATDEGRLRRAFSQLVALRNRAP